MEIDRYAIDSDMSRFTVRAFATGLFSSLGHSPTVAIRDFSGDAEFVPETLEKAALHLRIKASSLAVTDDVSEKDRQEMERAMNDSVLEVARYPEIAFDSSNVSASKAADGQYLVNMVGNLSLHGVTHTQAIPLQVSLTGGLLRAHGEFSVRQTEYAIKPVSVAGGTLKLKDELKCSFDIVARKRMDNE